MNTTDRRYNKIFGIGLSKTGTSSLGIALNQMGIPTKDFPHDPVTLSQLESGDYRLKLLSHFDAITDTPVVPYYPQLDKLYPGSKFVLTVRDIESWLRSIRDHWADRGAWLEVNPVQKRFAYFINTAVYGSIAFNEDRFRYVYDLHLREVRRYFADRPDDLLEVDICAGETMGRLGHFLGVDVADEPFPRANTKSDRQRNQAWVAYLRSIASTLDEMLPPDAIVLWADECQLVDLSPRAVRPAMTFPERNGVYQGRPLDDAQARRWLEALRGEGAQFIVFIQETMWWLDHYRGFAEHLRQAFDCIHQTPELAVFDLRTLKPSALAAR